MYSFRENLASQQNWCPTIFHIWYSGYCPYHTSGKENRVSRLPYDLIDQVLEMFFRIGYIEPYRNNFHIQHAQPPDLSCRLYVRHGPTHLVTGK